MARKDPILAFCFKVTISTESIDATTGFFRSVGGLSSETEVVEHAEGGVNDSTHKLVGRIKWKNLVLKRGMCGKELLKWRDQWTATTGAKTRRSGTIEQLAADGKTVVAKWTFSEGWPVKWEVSELDATKSEISVETLEIAHEGLKCEINWFDRVPNPRPEITMSETRALNAALSGPVFQGAATRSALHASERHVDRWAPEGPAATRSRGLRSLAFADRVASPWMSAAMQSRGASMMSHPTTDCSTPEVSWLFPRPWFQDELDWMAAARQGAEARPQFLTTRGTYESARTSPSDVAMPMLAPHMVAPSMAAAWPAMPTPIAMRDNMISSSQSSPQPLRSWSPSVSFAAVAAAEVIAGAVSAITGSGLSNVAERSPIVAGLTMLTPMALAAPSSSPTRSLSLPESRSSSPSVSSSPTYAAPASSYAAPSPSYAAPSPSYAAPTAAPAMIEAALGAIARVEERRGADRQRTVSEVPAAPVAAGVEAPTLVLPTVPASSAGEASPMEASLATAAEGSSRLAGALRTVDLLFHAAMPSSYASPSSASPSSSYAAPSSSYAASPSSAAPSPSYASPPSYASSPSYATSAASNLAPSIGPRVAMPAGLGGLVSSIAASQAVSQPMARFSSAPGLSALTAAATVAARPTAPAMPFISAPPITGAAPTASIAAPRAFAPVWAQPASALTAIAGERARAVDHLAWSDRWLARFSGASPLALAALDAASSDATSAAAAEPRWLSPRTPDIVYVRPPQMGPATGPMSAATLGAALAATNRAVAPIPTPAPIARPTLPAARADRAFRIDDTEAVSDDVFAAIAAAAAAPSPARPTPTTATTATTAPSPVAAREAARELPPATLADRIRGGARPSIADLIAVAAPPAPTAGLSPGLTASPMAPALAGVLPLPVAPAFDPRSLFPESLGAAYLGGLLARSAAPIGVLSGAPTAAALAAAGSVATDVFARLAAPAMAESRAIASPDMVFTGPGAIAALAEARSWSRRDLAITPAALRVAESPSQPMVITGGDFDITLRRGPTPLVQRFAAPGAERAADREAIESRDFGRDFGPGIVEREIADVARPVVAPRAPRADLRDITEAGARIDAPTAAPIAGAPTAFAPTAADAVTTDAAIAARSAAPSPVIEQELFALRSALLAASDVTTTPLAYASHPMLMSTPIWAPSDVAPVMAPTARAEAGAAPSAAEAAAAPAAPIARRAPALAMPSVAGVLAPESAAPGVTAHAMPAVTGIARELATGTSTLHAPTAQTSTGRPGALAELALSWAIAEERSAADLSFDFVSPELVLAARVYGLSPSEAAQATRLAVAGPGAMASLATSLDVTFLRSFQQAQVAQQMQAVQAQASRIAAGAPAMPALSPAGLPIGPAQGQTLARSGATTASRAADGGFAPTAPGASSDVSEIRTLERAAQLAAIGELPATAGAAAPIDLPAFAAASATAPTAMSPTAMSAVASGFDQPFESMPSLPGAPGRLPRGSFLWPPAAVAALGMRALSPDGVAGLPVVALELLAAAAVADLGTFVTAFPSADQATIANIIRGARGQVIAPTPESISTTGFATAPSTAAASTTAAAASQQLSMPFAAAPTATAGSPIPATLFAQPSQMAAALTSEAEEMAAYASVPSAALELRARFQAVYVALAQSADGQSLSPSARAARAMALIARSDDGAMSTRERAATAWSVLPQVYQGGFDIVGLGGLTGRAGRPGTTAAPSIAAERAGFDPDEFDMVGDVRPGLGGLAARAGESLGSFVAPSGGEIWTAGGFSGSRMASRAPESQTYVDTSVAPASASSSPGMVTTTVNRPGRAFSQVGGSEPEIPPWFESAARRMLEERAPGTNMTIAEMVLVTAMPQSSAIAAATRGTSQSPAAAAPSGASGKGGEGEKPDVDKHVHEVYLEVLKLIDIARERSGDPFK